MDSTTTTLQTEEQRQELSRKPHSFLKCTRDGCNREVYKIGRCKNHYYRSYRTEEYFKKLYVKKKALLTSNPAFAEEYYRLKREYGKAYRQRIRNDPVKYQQFLKVRRDYSNKKRREMGIPCRTREYTFSQFTIRTKLTEEEKKKRRHEKYLERRKDPEFLRKQREASRKTALLLQESRRKRTELFRELPIEDIWKEIGWSPGPERKHEIQNESMVSQPNPDSSVVGSSTSRDSDTVQDPDRGKEQHENNFEERSYL